jgi:hypothetical protein
VQPKRCDHRYPQFVEDDFTGVQTDVACDQCGAECSRVDVDGHGFCHDLACPLHWEPAPFVADA